MHSDLPRAGWFECSEPLVNKLTLNSLWGQKGNFLDVPTDCPQRDERAGWTGDAEVFMKTACFNMDAPGFYTKWLVDLCDGFPTRRRRLRRCGATPERRRLRQHRLDRCRPGLQLADVSKCTATPGCSGSITRPWSATWIIWPKTSKDFVRGTGAYGDWLRLAGPQHSEAIGTAYYYYTAHVDGAHCPGAGQNRGRPEISANSPTTSVPPSCKNYIKPDGRIIDNKNERGRPSMRWPSAWTWFRPR